jgi:hypothetical protein
VVGVEIVLLFKKDLISRILFILSMLIMFDIYYFWFFPFYANVVCLTCIAFLIIQKGLIRITQTKIYLSAFVLTLFLYFSFPGERGFFVYKEINALAFIMLLLADRKFLMSSCEALFGAIAILLIPSMIYYIMIVLGYDLSYTVFFEDGGGKSENGHFYRVYWGAVFLDHLIISYNGYNATRLLGIFDEPGYLGTIIALYLTLNKFKLDSLKNKILLVAGIMSMSLAFYLLCMIYFILNSLFFNHWRKLFYMFIVFAVLVTGALNLDLKIPVIERIADYSDDITKIDNREGSQFSYEFERFIQGDEINIFTGMGNAAHTVIKGGSSSAKSLLYNYGLIGCVGILLLYAFSLVYIGQYQLFLSFRNVVPFICVFLFSIYQRPDVLNPVYFMLFIYGIGKNLHTSEVKLQPLGYLKSRSLESKVL